MGARMITDTIMTEALDDAGLYRLMTWLSPSYPVGAFSYSHGLEYAVEDGTVTDAASLGAWLTDLLRFGSGRNDAILFCHAHAAAQQASSLAEVAALGAAFVASSERHLETTAQGRAFAEATADAVQHHVVRANQALVL